MTQLVNFIENADFSKDKVSIHKLLETPLTKEIQIALPAGVTMKEHSAPYAITVMLLKGNLDFYVGQDKFNLKVGDLIYLEAKVMHSLTAIENSVVRLSLAKADSLERVEAVAK